MRRAPLALTALSFVVALGAGCDDCAPARTPGVEVREAVVVLGGPLGPSTGFVYRAPSGATWVVTSRPGLLAGEQIPVALCRRGATEVRAGRVLRVDLESDLAVLSVDPPPAARSAIPPQPPAGDERVEVRVVSFSAETGLPADGTPCPAPIFSSARLPGRSEGRAVLEARPEAGLGGGPVVDAAGRLVGVLAPAVADSQVRFVIPAGWLTPVIQEAATIAAGRPREPSPGPRRGGDAADTGRAPATDRGSATDRAPATAPQMPELRPDAALELPGAAREIQVTTVGAYPLVLAAIDDPPTVAVIDPRAQRVLTRLDQPEPGFIMAAAGERLLSYLPKADRLDRWDLQQLVRNGSVRSPFPAPLVGLVGGHASGARLLGVWRQGREISVGLLDGQMLGLLDTESGRSLGVYRGAAADAAGSAFVLWGSKGVELAEVARSTLRFRSARGGADSVVFGDDGRLFLDDGRVLDRELRPLGQVADAGRATPASSSGLYLVQPRHSGIAPSLPLEIRTSPDDEVLTRVRLRPGTDQIGWETPTPVRHLPRVDRLVTLGPDRRTLLVYRYNLDEAAAEGAPIHVRSAAPPLAMRGSTWSYLIEGRSPHGGLSYVLQEGPSGAGFVGPGRLEWLVPHDAPERVQMVVRLHDGAGRGTRHGFEVFVP